MIKNKFSKDVFCDFDKNIPKPFCEINGCTNLIKSLGTLPPKKEIQVIFTTNQTEGRECAHYLEINNIWICEDCLLKRINGSNIYGAGAQGIDEFFFKEVQKKPLVNNNKTYMKVKTFCQDDYVTLDCDVNNFIEDRDIIDIKFTVTESISSIDGDADSKTWYFAMVIYKD